VETWHSHALEGYAKLRYTFPNPPQETKHDAVP
jgi:hypothetical protein